MPKLTMNTPLIDMVSIMSEGNPGAVHVITQLVKTSQVGIIKVLTLDELEIYGSDIWVLFKDCCNESTLKVTDVLTATLSGKISVEQLKEYIESGKEIELYTYQH